MTVPETESNEAQKTEEICKRKPGIPDVPIPSGPYLNSVEAACYLRLSLGTIANLVSEGKIPFAKAGRRRVFRRTDLDEYVEKSYKPAVHNSF